MEQQKIIIETLINIDSSDRNINPKNICISNNKNLPMNPISLINSNELKFNYPNHNLQIGDNIVINNVSGFSKILSNEFYLIKNFKYILINLSDSGNFIYNKMSSLYINIDTFSDLTESNFLNNIPFNSLIGIKESFIANDISIINFDIIKNIIIDMLNITDPNNFTNYINNNCIFIELPTEYINNDSNFYIVNQTFKIEYLHINGIKLGYINSDYPINSINYQSSQEIYRIIDYNNFTIKLNINGFINNQNVGGNNIRVKKIINSLDGYPNSNNYTINLKKTFSNVIDIKIISSEFPYSDLLVKNNKNDKLYWQNIEDGTHIYNIQIDEGFYTSDQLLLKIQTLMNNVERINSSNINKIYNNFNIIMESNTNTIIFNSFKVFQLPNSLSIRKVNIDNNIYYILNVIHYNNIVKKDDIIKINYSTDVTFKTISNSNIQIFSIAASYINVQLSVYAVNSENQSYDIILGKINQITTTLVNYETAGGENITITVNSKFRFLFNKNDTIGNELGFKNVGDQYSITDFKNSINNSDTYINNINLDSVGNQIIHNHGFFNFAGKYNYFLMYLNDIEFIYSSSSIKPAFAKILLSGNPGDILFNTFVEQSKYQYDKIFPISNLSNFNITFLFPDGNLVDFRNLNHSFTLKITEEKIQNSNTFLNSKYIKIQNYFK
jgi:hypothetical protein